MDEWLKILLSGLWYAVAAYVGCMIAFRVDRRRMMKLIDKAGEDLAQLAVEDLARRRAETGGE